MSRLVPGDRVRILALGRGYMPCEDQGLIVGYLGTVTGELPNDRVMIQIDKRFIGDVFWMDSEWPFDERNLERIAPPVQYAKVVPIKSERSLRRYTVGDNPWRIELRYDDGVEWRPCIGKAQAYRCLRGQYRGNEYRELRAVQPGLPLSPTQ